MPVMTAGAERFIGTTTLGALASEPVQTRLWDNPTTPIPYGASVNGGQLIVPAVSGPVSCACGQAGSFHIHEISLTAAPRKKLKRVAPVTLLHVAAQTKQPAYYAIDNNTRTTWHGAKADKDTVGGLSDARTFTLDEGLSWLDPAGRTRTVTELDEWKGARAAAGRMAPRGFPRDNRFT